MKLKFWLPPVIWAGLIFTASSLPTRGLPPLIPHADKVAHFIIYGILALLLYRALHGERKFRPLAAVLLSVLLASAYGALDEFHQYFVPSRSMDILDWMADTLGALIASTCRVFIRHAPRT